MQHRLHKRTGWILTALCLYSVAVACVSMVRTDPQTHGWWKGLGPVMPHDSFPADCSMCHVGGSWHTLREDFVFDHEKETGLYTGNARAWQDNNYVRAEKLLIQQQEGTMFAEGKVQSMIYDTTRTVAGKKSKTPVYAAADKMFYQNKTNSVRYENNVDIRQGTDRIVAGIANVYLDKNSQLKQTVVERNVVITQPNRRASGTYARYTASDESVILRGNPAKVVDAENGSSSGKEMVVYLRENRVISKGKTNQNSTGRTRTVYKIKNGKIN